MGYSYGFDMGQGPAFGNRVILSPPASFTHIRARPATSMCQPAIPACGRSAIDVSDVMAAIREPDVQAAFAQTTGGLPTLFFGADPRPNGEVILIGRQDGAAFQVGTPCPPDAGASCREIRAGVSRLAAVLRALE